MIAPTLHRLGLTILLVVLTAPTTHAQDDDLGRISLAVVTPESYAGLNAGQLASLRGKIVRMVTTHGLSGDGRDADLVIYPVLDVYDRRTVEGLRTLTVVRGELSLYVKNVAQDIVFASFSTPVQGHGTSERKALTEAIRSVQANDRTAADFFDTARRRIADYYETECDNLMDRARSLTQAQLFDQAFGLTMSVPTAAPACYGRAQMAVEAVFEAYRAQRCSEQVQAAHAAAARNDYARALAVLANVDPRSDCHADAAALVRTVSGEVDARDRRYYEAAQEAYRKAARLASERLQADAGLRRERLRAARDVARAYYAHRTVPVPYRTLVTTTVVR